MIALLILALALTGCGGVFLPPPPPGPVCVQNIQGEWLNCDCYQQTGAFTWKGWKLRPCPKPVCVDVPQVRQTDICEEVGRDFNCWNCEAYSDGNACCTKWGWAEPDPEAVSEER